VPGIYEQVRREMAPIAAAGAWNMGQWDQMETYVGAIEPRRAASTSATAFLRAVLDVHHRDFRAARGDYSLHESSQAY
jgi:serine/threonine-protein kinase mTOR